ncbi:MAG: energy transducer TonB [Acidobacteriota bacterium]
MNRSTLLAGALGAAVAIAFALPAGAGNDTLKTTYVVLVGKPATTQGDSPRVHIEPGTVILPGPQVSAAASAGYLDLVRKLEPSYRLGELSTAKRGVLTLIPGEETPVDLGLASVGARVKLLAVQPDTATLEVTITDKGRVVSQPRIMAARGRWATIGTMDGEAAPYVFLLLGPWTREDLEIEGKQADLVLPELISGPPPTYPEAARKARTMGLVILRGTIGVDGSVSGISVVESPDDSLSKAATEAFAGWRFKPGTDRSGTAVPVEYKATFNFKLS